MADIVLKNNTKHPRRMLVFNLTREIAPVKVHNRTMEETRDGVRRVRQSSKLVPDSVRIAHGETSRPLPADVVKVPEIAKAIDARELIVLDAPKDAGPKPAKKPVLASAPAAPAPAASEAPKGKERRRK